MTWEQKQRRDGCCVRCGRLSDGNAYCVMCRKKARLRMRKVQGYKGRATGRPLAEMA